MGSATRPAFHLLAAATVLGALLPAVLAHGDDGMNMDGEMGGAMNMSAPQPENDAQEYPPNYFSHPEYRGILFAHIALMVSGWVFVLPLGESRSSAPSHKVFC